MNLSILVLPFFCELSVDYLNICMDLKLKTISLTRAVKKKIRTLGSDVNGYSAMYLITLSLLFH